ncbi:MAG TPA: amino acid ABC transporter substrate-binding protein [Actinomycetota bacterium]
MRRVWLRRALLAIACALTVLAATCTSRDAGSKAPNAAGSGVLEQVKQRGKLRCGVNKDVPGFGFLTPAGTFAGFDIDFCHVIATAVLGNPDAVEFKPLDANQRFPALQSGEIDVLVRNTTVSASRDGADAATFAVPTFYDGQGMMVKASSKVRTLQDLQDSAVCVLAGTTNELNLASQFAARGIRYEPRSFQTVDTLRQAFTQGRCDAWTSDKSQLAGLRSTWPADQGGPAALVILPDTLSKEPLAPAVRDGDARWAQAVDWAVLSTIQAEEFGLTKANVDQVRTSTTDPEVKRFLGLPLQQGGQPFDPKLGLPVDFAYKVVKQVGSYGEIYDRNVGPSTPLGLARGLNQLWSKGGLLYAPPYR